MAAPSLPRWLRDALPGPLRASARLERRRAGALTLYFGPADAPRHVVDVFTAAPGKAALLRLGALGFGYRETPALGDGERARRFCEALAATLYKAEGPRLEAFVAEAVAEAEAEARSGREGRAPPAGASVTVMEIDLIRHGLERALAMMRAEPGPIAQLELFLAAACDQACRFCVFPALRGTADEVPPSPDVVEWAAVLFAELDARPGRSRLTLSGPDVLRHPRLDALLELVARYPALELELLGPMTGLADPAVAEVVLAVPNLVGVRTTLLSHRPEVHDALVGRAGAHADVLAALEACAAGGVPVGLNALLSPENVADLGALLAFAAPRGLDLQLSLYHPEAMGSDPEAWRELELERLVVGPAALWAALEAVSPEHLERASARLIPHCWIPPRARAQIVEAMEDLQDNFRQAPACARCSARARCPGLTVPALERLGPSAARPLE